MDVKRAGWQWKKLHCDPIEKSVVVGTIIDSIDDKAEYAQAQE